MARPFVAFICCAAGLLNAQVPDLIRGGVRTDHETWNLGPTGMSGRMDGDSTFSNKTVLVRQIEVMKVNAGSPADRILQVVEVILGVDGTGANPSACTSDARKSIANTMADAEMRNPGVLKLLVWRNGSTSTEAITRETIGAYSAAAPCNWPKSAAILDGRKRKKP